MLDRHHAFLLSLLDAAVSPEVFAAARTSEKPTKPAATNQESKSADARTGPTRGSDLEEGVAIIRFLIEKEELDLSGYPEWIKLAIAFKNTYGEDCFAPWLAFSEANEGFESEEACRKAWDAIKPRHDGVKLTIATYVAQAQALGWKPRQGSPRPHPTSAAEGGGGAPGDAEDDSGGKKGPGKSDPAAYTLGLVEEAGDELWLDQEGKPHVTFAIKLPGGREVKRHAPIDSGVYKSVLAHRFYEAAGTKVLKKDQQDSAAALLEFQARESDVQHVAALRVGERQGRIYVDLGTADGSAVEIDGTGWKIVPDAPIRFVRGSRAELPVPDRGGTLAHYERHFNLSSDDLLRLLGYLIGTFNVGASFAILMIDGEQGSGKSSLGDKAVGMVDPPRQAKSARMSFNPKEQDLHIGALGVHVPYFDNVSTFSADAADALCRMSTGGGSGARKLYTDDGYNQLVVVRPILLTCIGPPSARPDLLDRSVRIVAQPLEGHRTERAVARAFNADRPKMLGYLYDCVSAALRNRDAVEAAVERGDFRLPRMADFAEFVEGAGEVLGLPLGGFAALLKEGQSAMQVEAVNGHPVGAALIAYFSLPNPTPITASASDVLTTLRGITRGDHKWPAANAFGKTLKRISVGLRHLGIEWEATDPEGHANVATYKIWVTADFQPRGLSAQAELDDGGGRF